jgi:hypothetical protein
VPHLNQREIARFDMQTCQSLERYLIAEEDIEPCVIVLVRVLFASLAKMD